MQITEIRQKSLLTAIKTPFNRNGNIDITKYDELVEQQVAAGVDGLIVGGTTGEGHLLDWEEHLMLISHTANHYGDKLVVIGNTGSNNTREAIKATKYGFASGMHASLLINPYYGKTTQAGVSKHLELGLNLGPGIIYNVPGRTGQDISVDTMVTVSQHENFVGVKECAGNERIEHYESQGIACWSGNDDECFVGRHQFKSHGVISVTSNLVPALMRRLMDENDESLNKKLAPLYQWLFDKPNPAPLNTALSITGAIEPVIRLPYLPLSQEARDEFVNIINEYEPQDVVGDKRLSLLNEDFVSLV